MLCQRHLLPVAALSVLLVAGANAVRVAAQSPPVAKRVSPVGVNPGAPTRLTVTGGELTGIRELWMSTGPFGLAGDVENNGELKDRAIFEGTLPVDTPLGLQSLRIVGAGGVSSQRLWLVDDLPTVAQGDGNLSRDAAQPAPFPCAVDGVMGNLQRRFFQIDVSAGQRVAIDVYARRLGSSLDPLVVLYLNDGHELASSDDQPGLGGDCQLVHHCDVAGSYVIELRDIRYRGGDDYPFRLRIGDFPCVQGTYPGGVQRGTSATVELSGLDASEVSEVPITVPADWPHDFFAVTGRRSTGGASGFATIAVTDRPEVLEQEPNDAQENATPAAADQNLNGRLQQPGDVDLYRLTVEKGTRLQFVGVTRLEGSPADLALRILDATGKQLATADDDGVNEGRLDHTFAEAGDYFLEVADLVHRGGPAFVYRVEVSPWRAGFELAIEGDAINIPAGGSAVIPVVATRRGYNGEIALHVAGLPDGATAAASTIGAGQTRSHVSLSLPAADASLDLTTLAVTGTATIGGQEVRATAEGANWLRGQWNNLAVVPPVARRSLLARSAPAGKMALEIEPAEVVFGPDLKAHVNVRVRRAEGVDGEVTLVTNPEKDALPKEVSLEVKPIPKDADHIALQFSGSAKAPLGAFSLVLTGTLKQDKATFTATTPVINFRVAPVLTLEVQPGDGPLKIGGELPVTIRVRRNPAFAGAVTVKAEGLPAGVTLADVAIPPDATEVQAKLVAAAEVAAGPIKGAKLKAAAADNASLTGEITLPEVIVE
ncbi:MAG: PPC domain-containing protein [Planctomycetaceae bacterium]|nr:PPC domain-containing protein [Planctomycetaceae bacterium]